MSKLFIFNINLKNYNSKQEDKIINKFHYLVPGLGLLAEEKNITRRCIENLKMTFPPSMILNFLQFIIIIFSYN